MADARTHFQFYKEKQYRVFLPSFSSFQEAIIVEAMPPGQSFIRGPLPPRLKAYGSHTQVRFGQPEEPPPAVGGGISGKIVIFVDPLHVTRLS